MKLTPEQRHFRDRLLNLEAEWARVEMLTDLAETRAALVSGRREWDDDTALAYATALVGA